MEIFNLDSIDRKILQVLQSNARITIHEMADQIGLSASPVARRIKILEKNGLIKGYAAILDEGKLGYDFSVFVSVQLEKQIDKALVNFEKEIMKRDIKPTKFLPLWDLLGVGLGFGSTILGKKAAMLCTASVEEVIDEHYQNQINQLGSDEKNLKEKITKFREDELHHKNIAYDKGATKKGLYSVMDKIIKTGSKIAISISEKI